jgi:hypothetical protein
MKLFQLKMKHTKAMNTSINKGKYIGEIMNFRLKKLSG